MNSKQVMNHAADNIRILAASMVEKAKSGHPGGAMGGADFINVLYSEFLQYDPANPKWEGRDRFFLDPGHMAPMLYSQLALIGKFTLDELKQLLPSSWPHVPVIRLLPKRLSTHIFPTEAFRKKSPKVPAVLPAASVWTTWSCSTTPTTSSFLPKPRM